MKLFLSRFSRLAFCAAAILAARPGHAQGVVYHVNVNTAALVGDSSGPFSLDFQLNDGSGLGDGNNTAFISNFAFGSGSASGSPSVFGGASGNLSTGVTLTDTAAFNELFQAFNAGGTVSFDVNLTLHNDAGPTPDAFSFAILDSSLYNLATTGVGDTFFLVSLGALPFTATGSSISPAVTLSVTTVPEPGSLAFFSLGLVAFGLWRRVRLAPRA